MPQIAGIDDFSIRSIKVYRAYLEEKLVEREAIPEYKLINIESKQPSVELVNTRNHHELYLFEILPDTKQADTVYVFLATSFNARGQCLGLGPAYLGFLRIDQLVIKKILKISRKDDVYQLKAKKRTDLIFLAEEELPQLLNTSSPIRIKQIIRLDPNKIGGEKPIVFTIEKIFNDPDALVFTFHSTIDR
ncbi:MAG TPA: hypothetical protein VGQ09_18370 [Chitinophagaceae bacterium]|nr:hypothetical protein [Chitinophagaceae bacterium]